MSGNHNQSLERALAIVDEAAKAGAHAFKIQTYTADTMTLDMHRDGFVIGDPQSLWHGESLYDLYRKAYTPWEWHKPIFDRCKERGMIGFSSPFDAGAVDFLETLDVPCYKIASFEITDLPLIRKAAMTGKPLIISTGMATAAEIDEAVAVVQSTGNRGYALLKCTSTYPASPEGCNLRTIEHMAELFDCPVGLSDHTFGVGVGVAAVSREASILEKHFTLSRAEGGVDSAFSLEPDEFRMLADECMKAWQSLGTVHYGPTAAEIASLKFRRSIYVTKDLEAGDMLLADNIRIIRPGYGLEPKYWDTVIGRTVKQSVAKGTPLNWQLIG